MDTISRKRLTVPLAPLIAGGCAVFVALVFALMPADMLGRLALDSGIAALVPAAEPPLGTTARMALVLVGGGGIGLVAWFALYLLIGTRSISIAGREAGADAAPVLRRADAHPDAPARRPLFANEDLGTPFLEVRAPVHLALDDGPRDLPVDLDQPIKPFDRKTIPESPADWFPPPVSLSPGKRPQVFEPGERFETFELGPVAPATPRTAVRAEVDKAEGVARGAAPVARKPEFDASASIHALLDRLEKGVAKPAAAPVPAAAKPDGLQESLASLRRLATSR